MNLERRIRLIAGSFVLLSLTLAYVHSRYWLWFTAFVGANLIQSSITRWCLMEDILRAAHCAGPQEGTGAPQEPPRAA